MNVSPNELRRETSAVLKLVNDQIREVQEAAAGRGISPAAMHDERGQYVMPPLLLAKTQCLHTLTLLNEQGKKR